MDKKCKKCKKGFNQPLAEETICCCRESEHFLKKQNEACKEFEKRTKTD